MEKYIKSALIANAATLGVHWIYDHVWLKKEALGKSLWFKTQSSEDYAAANPSYYVYPNMKLGDVTVQGQMMIWLYQAMKQNPSFNQQDYAHLVYQQFKPGGEYHGYVESYAKKQVMSMLSKEVNVGIEAYEKNDDHLVGFIPYFVSKELSLSNERAFELTQLYTNDTNYLAYFKLFDFILNHLALGLQKAIEQAIEVAPTIYQSILKQAIQIKDTETFVINHAGRACAIQYSIPVIIHLLYHHHTFEAAMDANIIIGGAIADRAMFLGMIYHQITPIHPKYYQKLTHPSF